MGLTKAQYRDDQKLSLLGNFTSEASSDKLIERRRAGKPLAAKQKEKEKGPGKSQEGEQEFLVISLLLLLLGRTSWLPLTKGLCSTMSKKTQKASCSQDLEEA